jgi:apolipoprotein N-acyltransferase
LTPSSLIVVLLAAGAYALALPPFDQAWLAWGTLVPVLIAARRLPPGRAFAVGALYGFAMAWAVTWWLSQAIAAYFAASLLFGATTISVAYVSAVSLNIGAFAAGVSLLHRRALAPWARVVGTASLWVATELVRGRLMQDPWALLGYTQHGQHALIQIAALTGVYGVSFLVALGNAALAEVLLAADAGRWWHRLLAIRWPVAVLVAAWSVGRAHLPVQPPPSANGPRIAVVQPNVAPAFRWTRPHAERQMAANLRLTQQVVARGPALVVWPENAVTLQLEQEPFFARRLAMLARESGADVLFGAPRPEGRQIFNSARLWRADGTQAHYDKRRLVPFAEAPIGGARSGASPADPGPMDRPTVFSAGTAPGVLRGVTDLGVSICHEVLYPELVADSVRAGARLLVNVANDGWLDGGYGVASRQHFAMAVFRAVENRRYLVRAATTGVSGIVDPYGRVVQAAEPGEAAVLLATVQPRRDVTPYARMGDVFAGMCVLVAGLLLLPPLSLRVRLWMPSPAPVR